MKQIYDAAGPDSGQPDHHRVTDPLPVSLKLGLRATRIEKALHRASQKSFVRAIKPLRRFLRNQGAVNDSLIEGITELFVQTQAMIEEIGELQRRISSLENQIQQLRPGRFIGTTTAATD
ncbi:MAG TPA: hypothetical protein VGM62_19665 [Chthoniobacterales bacterium]|jgi:hypothetical protein